MPTVEIYEPYAIVPAGRQRDGVGTRDCRWWPVDGGAIRIRVYMVGTAHLEIHPEMAWRLNAVLAHLHPMAIPANARQRPAKKAKEWAAIQRPLPAAVLTTLAEADGVRHDRGVREIKLRHYTHGACAGD